MEELQRICLSLNWLLSDPDQKSKLKDQIAENPIEAGDLCNRLKELIDNFQDDLFYRAKVNFPIWKRSNGKLFIPNKPIQFKISGSEELLSGITLCCVMDPSCHIESETVPEKKLAEKVKIFWTKFKNKEGIKKSKKPPGTFCLQFGDQQRELFKFKLVAATTINGEWKNNAKKRCDGVQEEIVISFDIPKRHTYTSDDQNNNTNAQPFHNASQYPIQNSNTNAQPLHNASQYSVDNKVEDLQVSDSLTTDEILSMLGIGSHNEENNENVKYIY